MEHKNLNLQPASYIPSTEAAVRFGLTNDHIASLCRRHKVAGVLKGGRVWFVNEESLKNYVMEVAEQKMARHKALSQKIRSEHQARPMVEDIYGLTLRHAAALALPLFLAIAVNIPGLPADMSGGLAMAGAQYHTVLEVALELQVDAYQTLGAALTAPVAGDASLAAVAAEIPEASARFYEGLARDWIAVVESVGDTQEKAYTAVIGVLYAFADDMSAATILAVEDISYSATAAAVWYIDSSQTVYAKTQLH